MSFWVKRTNEKSPTGFSYIGPIRSAKRAEREADAWIEEGFEAEVLRSDQSVRNEVRAWEKAKKEAGR